MKELMCENCGNKSFIEDNGIPTCDSCGTKYPEFSLNKVGIEEELKEKEIRRLVEANRRGLTFKSTRLLIIFPFFIFGLFLAMALNPLGFPENIITSYIIIFAIIFLLYRCNFFHTGQNDLEPSLNVLSDEEILKYAPKSKAANLIIKKREGVGGYIKKIFKDSL